MADPLIPNPNGVSLRNQSGRCWLPYHLNAANYCFAMDRVNVGQWVNGYRSIGGNEVLLDGRTFESSSSRFSPPAPPGSTTNRGAVTVAVGGGTVGGAAVVGIVLFNRKRKLKYAPNSGSSSEQYASTV